MSTSHRRTGIVLIVFGLAMLVIVTLAFSSTSWAAPNAQGTVPTAPAPGDPTTTPGDGNGDNGSNDNGSDNGDDSSTNGDTATPVAPGAGTVCAIGETGAQCAAPDLIVVAAAGAANAGSALTIEGSFPQPPCPASPAGHNFLNRCYRYTWIGTNAQPLEAISAPVQYCISYGAEQLASAHNDANALLIGVAGADGKWTLLKPTADAANNRTCATSNQLIVWSALFAPQSASPVLPTVGAPPDNMWLAVLALGGILILVGVMQFRRRAK